jgi:putative phage-type endonuclease
MTAPTLQRVTPTGVLVMSAEQIRDRQAWLAARRKGIGSSDIAAILDLDEAHNTAVHVWNDKLGNDVDRPNEAALWGTLNEPTVAEEWCRRNRSVIHNMGLIARYGSPWMLASLDRRVAECPLDDHRRKVCALEVKTRSVFKASRWHKDVPDDVLAQAAWQIAVSGYDHVHVAVLIGGNDYHQAVVTHNEQLEAFCVDGGRQFWEVNVGQRIEPAWNMAKPDRLIEMDERLHPDRVGEIDIEAVGDVMEYARVASIKNEAERERKVQAARLRELAGGKRYVKFAGELAYELSPRSKANVDLERLAEQHPAAYADCVTETAYHQISIAPAFKGA